MKKSRIILLIIALIMFISGLVFFLYPVFIRYRFNQNTQQLYTQLEDTAEDARNDQSDKYADLYRAMVKYNKELYQNGQEDLVDQLSYEKPDFLLSDYGVNNGEILGSIEIPEIDVKLPILNGADFDNMSKGAVYLAHTSLPVGGNNTNCVIAAHNTWDGVDMFMDIPELEKGDKIYIENFWGVLEYKVCETKIIAPDNSKDIYIQPGRQLVTLSTCYPFPDNNKRYLVFAERV
ncbi:MAG: class C sortase [Oscillospiraceae bacterium]